MEKQSSRLNLIKKAFQLSLLNIWRNKFLSVATIFVIGIIIFIFNIILAINFIARDALSDLSKKIDVVVYLKESTTFQDAKTIIKDVSALTGVDNAIYFSKEDALQQIKTTHPDLSIAFEKYGLGNPLPASINVTTSDPSFHESIGKFLQQDKYQIYLSNVVTSGESENDSIMNSVSKNLSKVTDFAHQIIFWLVVTFVVGGALITLNALQITIFNRKQEITVMKLVGAPRWFIRLPFIMESVIYGICAVILSFVMLLILSQKIQIQDTSLIGYYSNIKFLLIFLVELGITVVLSVASSIMAVHEYMHQKSLH